jgi:hypothetical protein
LQVTVYVARRENEINSLGLDFQGFGGDLRQNRKIRFQLGARSKSPDQASTSPIPSWPPELPSKMKVQPYLCHCTPISLTKLSLRTLLGTWKLPSYSAGGGNRNTWRTFQVPDLAIIFLLAKLPRISRCVAQFDIVAHFIQKCLFCG